MWVKSVKGNMIAALIILALTLGVLPCLGGQNGEVYGPDKVNGIDDTARLSFWSGKGFQIHYINVNIPIDEGAEPIGIIPGPFDDIPLKGAIPDTQTMDLAILYDSAFIKVHRAYSDGTYDYDYHDSINTGAGCRDMDIGDFDRDGIVDILVANAWDSSVTLHCGNGDATFNNTDTFYLSGAPRTIDLGDLNRDGNLDIVLAMESQDEVYIMFGNGEGGIAPTVKILSMNSTPIDAEIGNFNDDNIPDIVVARGSNGIISIFAGSESDTITSRAYFEKVTGGQISHISTSDLDNNLRNDIVAVYGDTSAAFTALLNKGDNYFEYHSYPTILGNHSGIAIADYGGDGRADVAISSFSSDSVIFLMSTLPKDEQPPNENDQYRFISPPKEDDFYLNWAVSIFDSATFKDVGYEMIDIVSGDFNYDMLPDFMALNADSGKLAVLYSTDSSNINSSIDVVYPNGGEFLAVGTEQEIQWRKGRGIISVDIQISRNDGELWETIAENQSGLSYTWLVTGPSTGSARICVRDAIVPNRYDKSDAVFSIGCLRGDVNQDNRVNLEDVVRLVNHVLSGVQISVSYDNGDVDCNGVVDVNDLVWLINYLYAHGNAPCDLNGDGLPDC